MKFSVLFAVGANCVRPRAFTERPYEDDFLSVGKTCFMEGTPSGVFFRTKKGLEKRFELWYDVGKSFPQIMRNPTEACQSAFSRTDCVSKLFRSAEDKKYFLS